MKKLVLLTAIILVSVVSFGQTIQKGSLIGTHVVILKLKPDATYNQWKDLLLNEYIPKFEEAMQGDVKLYLLEGIRGENKSEIGFLYVYSSEAARDKYNNDDGSLTEYGKQTFAKLDVLLKEFEKYQKSFGFKYTDWIVQ